MHFDYQSERFSAARSLLMLPHPHGEAESIANAFMECFCGLHNLDRRTLDANARSSIKKLLTLMDTSGLDDPLNLGLWMVKAKKLTVDQRIVLSQLVDGLAEYFSAKCSAEPKQR